MPHRDYLDQSTGLLRETILMNSSLVLDHYAGTDSLFQRAGRSKHNPWSRHALPLQHQCQSRQGLESSVLEMNITLLVIFKIIIIAIIKLNRTTEVGQLN